jgi:hypothetical protein
MGCLTFFQVASFRTWSPKPFFGGGLFPSSVSTLWISEHEGRRTRPLREDPTTRRGPPRTWYSSSAAVSFTVAVFGKTLRASCKHWASM